MEKVTEGKVPEIQNDTLAEQLLKLSAPRPGEEGRLQANRRTGQHLVDHCVKVHEFESGPSLSGLAYEFTDGSCAIWNDTALTIRVCSWDKAPERLELAIFGGSDRCTEGEQLRKAFIDRLKWFPELAEEIRDTALKDNDVQSATKAFFAAAKERGLI